jgi:hypothetical protein
VKNKTSIVIVRLFISFSILLLLTTCNLLDQTEETPESGTGVLKISISSEIEFRTVLPSISMDIDHYELSCTGPGEQVSESIAAGTVTIQKVLLPGNWSVRIDALNADSVIIGSTGNHSVTLVQGQTANETMIITPLSGTGTLDIDISWQQGELIDPSVSASLIPHGGSANAIIFNTGTTSAVYDDSSIDAGYYDLVIKVYEGSDIYWGTVDVLRIISGKTTNASFSIPTTGLIAYFPFEGNADDSTGNGNNGTVYGATFAADRFGNTNSAYSFDGTDDYIDLGSTLGFTDGDSISISAWVKVDTISPDIAQIVSNYDRTLTKGIMLDTYNNTGSYLGNFRAHNVRFNNNYFARISANPPDTESWYHLVGVFKGDGTTYLYVNNTEEINTFFDGTINSSSHFSDKNFVIGRQAHYSSQERFFNGLIDDVRIYNRALTKAEVETLFLDGGWAAYSIGDTGPAGGIIFYDKGDDLNGWRYLEAAPVDQDSAGDFTIEWGGYGTDIGGSDAALPPELIQVGTGASNTRAILYELGDYGGLPYAARVCDQYSRGGYDDWFLPSIDELHLMYTNLHVGGSGGFSDVWYWSSSETGPPYYGDEARFHDFASDYQGSSGKTGGRNVRAIRAFRSADPTYTVSYYSNNGDTGAPPVDLNFYEAGDTITVLDNTGGLEAGGAPFESWNTEQDGSGDTYNPGETFPCAGEDVNLFAIYSGTPYLVAEYLFNANANDTSGYDNHGTPIGPILTTDRFRIADSAYEFDGTDDWIEAGNISVGDFTQDDFTISVWTDFYTDGEGANDHDEILSIGDVTNNALAIVRYSLDSGGTADPHKLTFVASSTGSGWNIQGYSQSLLTPQSGWRHCVITRNGNEYKFFIDGQLDATYVAPSSTFLMANQKLIIGRFYDLVDTSYTTNGKIDDIRIYSQVLTEQQITDLYNEGDWGYVEQLNSTLEAQGFDMRLKKIIDYHTTDTYRGMTLTSFALAETEVTQGDYELMSGPTGTTYDKGVGDNYPVYYVSWEDAADFCNALSSICGLDPVYNPSTYAADFTQNGFYLPTEPQWEYAAGGPDHYIWSLSDTFTAGDYAFSESQSSPVKSHSANGFGLYDMSGNVWEACNDLWGGSFPYTGEIDPEGTGSGSDCVVRGGRWGSTSEALQCEYRYYNSTSGSFYGVGFRVAAGGFGKWNN